MDKLQMKIRLSNDIKNQLDQISKENKRSLNAEINIRLQQSLSSQQTLEQKVDEILSILKAQI